jgi:putative transposase
VVTLKGALKMPPAPKRHTDTSWRQFLHSQAATMLAADFHLDCVLTSQRLYCWFIMEAGSCHVHILGSLPVRTGRGRQQIRNLLMALGDRATASGSWSVTAAGSSPNPSTRSWPAPASTV